MRRGRIEDEGDGFPDGGAGRPGRRSSGWVGWLLVISACAGFVFCYDRATRTVDGRVQGAEDPPAALIDREELGTSVWALAYSPDGTRLAAATTEGMVSLKDLASGHTTPLQDGPQNSARALAFSPDGRVLAVGGRGSTVRLWETATARELPPLRGQGERVDGLHFAPDGARLTVGPWDGPLTDWDWNRGRSVYAPERFVHELTRLAPALDGTTLAAGDASGRVTLWRGSAELRWEVVPGRRKPVTALAVSPDGKTLAVATLLDPVVRVYDTSGGAVLYKVGEGNWGVTALAYSPDGAFLAAADLNGKTRLYDAATGRPRATVGSPRPVYALVFSPDGTVFATGDHGGCVRLWSVARALAPWRQPAAGSAHDVHPLTAGVRDTVADGGRPVPAADFHEEGIAALARGGRPRFGRGPAGRPLSDALVRFGPL